MELTLRIKMIHLKSILDGSKTIEYRRALPLYKTMFKKPFKRIKLVCWQTVVTADIEKIELIPNPFHGIEYLNTTEVFAISLKNPVLASK